MAKGGRRIGAGVKPSWKNSETTTIRIPKVFRNTLRSIARMLDNNQPIEDIVEYLLSIGIPVEEAFGVSPNGRLNLDLTRSNQEFLDMVRKIGIEGFYYITHFENVSSILHRGILSHSQIEHSGICHKSIYNNSVIDRRSDKIVIFQKRLWDFANLYFQPRNAMLYSLVNGFPPKEDLAILCIKPSILTRENVFITDGNAASNDSKIFSSKDEDFKDKLKSIREQVDNDWWKKDDGSKRKIMAECLVLNKVHPSYIHSIYVANSKAKDKLFPLVNHYPKISSLEIPIVPDPKKFFQPDSRFLVRKNLFIIKGDMFFSRMQTLTISVNCVGVMGKGLASTAKYRFPDVYVRYEDLCKAKKLKMGSPYLHKRESSVFDDLSDDYLFSEPEEKTSQTWFLLFPTKEHWRNNSDISGIETGLKWICDNYKNQGISSLAIPALGCGLGKLDWRDVGPLMCKYLVTLDIPVAIYLPTEKEIEDEFISPTFLLSMADF